MVATCIEKIMQDMVRVTDVYSNEIPNMFLVGQESGLVENFSIWIYSGTIDVINVKLCMMVLLTELSLFTPLSVP